MDNQLNNLIFEYYEARILFGYYSFGDRLPSILKIGENFHLAPATVRAALARLEKAGYVRIDARRAAEVIYRADSSQLRENAARYFLPRRQGIADLSMAARYLVEPLWKTGLLNWDEHYWALLLEGLKNPAANPGAVLVEFYLLAVSALDNHLALNLFWELIRYLRFPYLLNNMEPYPGPADGEPPAKEDIIEFIRQQAEGSYAASLAELSDFTNQAAARYPELDRTPIPFQWNLYSQRPQLKYTFASRLIREIMSGSYPEGSYLPSLPQMVEKYKIPLMTVRRTLEIMEEIGLTRSYHGKGTQVVITPSAIDMSRPAVRHGLGLYLDSLQLLSLTIREISAETFKAADSKQVGDLLQSLEERKAEGRSYLCVDTCLSFLSAYCPYLMVRECYKTIQALITWGYPFTALRLHNRSLHEEYVRPLSEIIEALRRGNSETFSTALESLIKNDEERTHTWHGGS